MVVLLLFKETTNMKLFIVVNDGNGGHVKREVLVREVVENYFMKGFIHMNIEYPGYWQVSEFYTGMGLCGVSYLGLFKDVEELKKDFDTRSENLEAWDNNPEGRKYYNQNMIFQNLVQLGDYTNKEI